MAMGDEFRGLPMGELIGAPLTAACDAQLKLARATSEFITAVGFEEKKDPNTGVSTGKGEPRLVDFSFRRRSADPNATGENAYETVELKVPFLAIVNVPSLSLKEVNITFDMEIKSSESSKESEAKEGKFAAEASVGWGPFSAKVSVSGSVSSHKENTRSTDKSAKYHVEVKARDDGMPEGLSRVLDIMQSAIVPAKPAPSNNAGAQGH